MAKTGDALPAERSGSTEGREPADSESFVGNGNGNGNGHPDPIGTIAVPVVAEAVPHGAGLS